MTKAHLVRIVREWQRRLALERWDVEVDFAQPCNEDANATTWRSNTYDKATVRFDREWAGWSREFANQIVAHELLHLLARDLDELVKDAQDQMHRDAGTLVRCRYDHEIEGLVDRLAYRLVEVGGCV